jgi:hypothetical protein
MILLVLLLVLLIEMCDLKILLIWSPPFWV